jgi:hypothetical protein
LLAQPLAYMCVHISLTMMTFMLCKIWWCVFPPLAMHTILLITRQCCMLLSG